MFYRRLCFLADSEIDSMAWSQESSQLCIHRMFAVKTVETENYYNSVPIIAILSPKSDARM